MRTCPLLLVVLIAACAPTLAPERPRPLPSLDYARLVGGGRSPRDRRPRVVSYGRGPALAGPVPSAPSGDVVNPRPAPVAMGFVIVVRRRGTRRDGSYLALRSDPSGAEVFFGERHLGRTPLLLFLRRDARSPLRLTLPGYVPAEVPLPLRGRPTLRVHLRREDRPRSRPCGRGGRLIPSGPFF